MAYYPSLYTLEDIRERAYRKETVNGKTVVRMDIGPDCDSVETFANVKNPDWDHERSSVKKNNANWSGSNSYEQAAEWMRKGWPEGTERMKALSLRLQASLPLSEKVRMRYSPTVAPVGGMLIDLPGVISGSPTPYIGRFKTQTRKAGQKIIRLGINCTMSAGVSRRTIEARGAAILALVDQLQLLKYEVDLTVYTAVLYAGGRGLTVMWHVKPAGRRANLDQIAFAVANAGTLRRVMFGAIEHVKGEDGCGSLYGNYGMPAELDKVVSKEELKKYQIIVDSECYVDENGNKRGGYWDNPEDQKAWVLSQLRKQGVRIE